MDNCHTSDDQHHMEPSSNSEASCHTSKGKKKLEIFLWVNKSVFKQPICFNLITVKRFIF